MKAPGNHGRRQYRRYRMGKPIREINAILQDVVATGLIKTRRGDPRLARAVAIMAREKISLADLGVTQRL